MPTSCRALDKTIMRYRYWLGPGLNLLAALFVGNGMVLLARGLSTSALLVWDLLPLVIIAAAEIVRVFLARSAEVIFSAAAEAKLSTSGRRTGSSLLDLPKGVDEARARLLEVRLAGWLLVLAAAALLSSYLATRSVLSSVQANRFGPAETAQVITAAGGLWLAVGTGIAGIVKAYALLVRTRADLIHARRLREEAKELSGAPSLWPSPRSHG